MNNISLSDLVRNAVLEKIEDEYDLKSYYEAQRIATERDKLVTAMNAQKKIGNLQNNTSSDLEGNKQNAYLREELKTSLDSNKLYEHEQEKAARKIALNEPPAPVNIKSVNVLRDKDDKENSN